MFDDKTEEEWFEWHQKRPTYDVEAFADCLSFTIDKTSKSRGNLEIKAVGNHYRTIESTIRCSIMYNDLQKELYSLGEFFIKQAEMLAKELEEGAFSD